MGLSFSYLLFHEWFVAFVRPCHLFNSVLFSPYNLSACPCTLSQRKSVFLHANEIYFICKGDDRKVPKELPENPVKSRAVKSEF